jgi:hypothetical protein
MKEKAEELRRETLKNEPKNVRSNDKTFLGDDGFFDSFIETSSSETAVAGCREKSKGATGSGGNETDVSETSCEKESDGSTNGEKQECNESRDETAKKRLKAKWQDRGSDLTAVKEPTNDQ